MAATDPLPGGYSAATSFVYAGFPINGRSLLCGSAAAGSLQFFLITNLGVWLACGLYARTFAGLAQCFAMAIPFYGRTVV